MGSQFKVIKILIQCRTIATLFIVIGLIHSHSERAAKASPPLALLTVSHIQLVTLDRVCERGEVSRFAQIGVGWDRFAYSLFAVKDNETSQ